MTSMSDERRLTRGRVIILNVPKNAQLSSALQGLGMNIPTTLAEGQRLVDAAAAAMDHKTKMDGAVREAWDDLHQLHDTCWALFQDQRKRVSDDVEPIHLRIELELDENYAKTRATELEQMQRFYRRLLPNAEAQALLTSTKVSAEKLEGASDKVAKLTEDDANVIRLEAEKRLATDAQEAALGTLDAWSRKMHRRAEIACEENPGLEDVIDWDMFK